MDFPAQPLKICIDARLPDATIGGGAKVVIGLAKAFSNLLDGPEEYHFYTFSNANQWIQPYLHGPCRLLPGPVFQPALPKSPLKRRLSEVSWMRRSWHRLHLPLMRWRFRLPQSDGTVERAGFHLIHFTQQHAFVTAIPSIYQPHDLQHLHLPDCFTAREKFVRSKVYPAFSHQASMVVAMSQWGKEDLIKHFKLPPEKVQIVPWGPLTDLTEPTACDFRQAKEKFGLPDAFAFLPAQTWVHKNHIGLLKALKVLRDKHGLQIPLICSGQTNEFFSQIQQQIRSLDLSEQVRFVGFVTESELQCLYRLARVLVFPTRFEGWGLPITEALSAGLPVVCSNVTCLPAQVGDAALLFDPNNVQQMATQILRGWTDEPLRYEMIQKAKQRAAQFSWDHTARLFRAHYRRLSNRSLTEEDLALLSAPPLV